uniref:Endoplasmic reticulum transmembrane protein n=1 Tax=Plectus sambesii TaxID=2011161 RepID=A0A914UVF0_9BILA
MFAIQWSMINLQWSALTAILIVEIFFVILLLIPWISPKVWHAFFHSELVQRIVHWKYFEAGLRIVAAGLVLFLCDAIRSIYVYGQTKDVQAASPIMSTADKDALINMRVYQAERNFFIVGFDLFFGIILKRLITLICLEAELIAEADGTTLHVAKPMRERPPYAKRALEKLTKDD